MGDVRLLMGVAEVDLYRGSISAFDATRLSTHFLRLLPQRMVRISGGVAFVEPKVYVPQLSGGGAGYEA